MSFFPILEEATSARIAAFYWNCAFNKGGKLVSHFMLKSSSKVN